MRLDRTGCYTVLVLSLLLGACAPRLYERHTVTLDHDDIDQFEIVYAPFEGCLLSRPVPVRYRLLRPQYALTLDLHFGSDAQAPGIELLIEPRPESGETLSARFPDLSPPPAESGTGRYRIDAGLIREGRFSAEILHEGRVLGREFLRVQPGSCRALSLGDTRP